MKMRNDESNYFEFITIAPIYSDLFNLAMSLRREVFVEEQGVPYHEEFDGKDILATHIVIITGGNVCGTIRLIWNNHDNLTQISRFVVRKTLRGFGVGRKLMDYALKTIEQKGYSRIYLEAQLDKISFYEKFGFSAYGDEFLDGGILHRKMKNY
jgi:predicted GNAT family N-acyltransferase